MVVNKWEAQRNVRIIEVGIVEVALTITCDEDTLTSCGALELMVTSS